jgi:hypothetical protein
LGLKQWRNFIELFLIVTLLNLKRDKEITSNNLYKLLLQYKGFALNYDLLWLKLRYWTKVYNDLQRFGERLLSPLIIIFFGKDESLNYSYFSCP